VNITRDVVRDLWALREAGEASDDSQRLVEEFLGQDPEFALTLRSKAGMQPEPVPALAPEHAATTLARMKRRLGRRSPLRIIALGLTGLAIVRLLEQTTFTTSPAEVIALSIAAVVTWTAYGWHSRYLQRRVVFGK